MTNMDGIGKRGELQEWTMNLYSIAKTDCHMWNFANDVLSGSPVTEMKPRNPSKTLPVKRLVPATSFQKATSIFQLNFQLCDFK